MRGRRSFGRGSYPGRAGGGVRTFSLTSAPLVMIFHHMMVFHHFQSGETTVPDPSAEAGLSRRERQVMDAIHRRGRASVAEIEADLPDASYHAVRSALRVLRQKGLVRHEHDGRRYVYAPAAPRAQAEKSALRHLIGTFFQGSAARAMAAILELHDTDLPPEERERLARAIEEARRKAEEGGA
jgi:BlaI family transcriptional regulator, penicillinase repressor